MISLAVYAGVLIMLHIAITLGLGWEIMPMRDAIDWATRACLLALLFGVMLAND